VITRFLQWLPLLILLLLGGCMGSQNRPMQLLSGAGPVYPEEARAAGVQGDVVVRYGVSATGTVVNARIESAQPPGVFDQAALAAVRSWRYNPQIRDGEPQAVENILSTVRFRLDDDDRYDDL
jgi:protein TonB